MSCRCTAHRIPMTVPMRSTTTSSPRRTRLRPLAGLTITNLPRNHEPSLQLDDHPGLPENDEQSNYQRTEQGELHRPHADAQDRLGTVDVDVTAHVIPVDDARPVGVPALQDPGFDPAGEPGLLQQISHDVGTLGPNVWHLPHAFRELWTPLPSVLPYPVLWHAGRWIGHLRACGHPSSREPSRGSRPV